MGNVLTEVLPVTKVLDSNEGGFAPVDVSPYVGPLQFFYTAKSDAGTTPTCAVKLQHSDVATGASYTTDGSHDVGLRLAADNNVKLAATFTQSGAAQIKDVILILKKNGTISTTNLTLTIEGDSSGDPDDTAIGTATVSTDDIGDSYQSVTFTFATPVEVADATVYHLVLASDYTASGTNYIDWRANSGLTSGGNQITNNGSAWSADADDSQEFIIKQYAFADVTGGAFTTTTGTTADSEVIELPANPLKQYVRANVTITGSSTPAYYTGVMAYGHQN